MTPKEFEILARNIRPALVRASRQIVGSDDDAEDVVQDTMLKLWTLRDDLGEYNSIEALATLIVRRLSLNRLRANRSTSLDEALSSPSSDPTAEELMITHERTEYVDRILNSLPDTQQTLIRLRHIEGYDNTEIAKVLGSTEGAVRTALSRARRSVAEKFNINRL